VEREEEGDRKRAECEKKKEEERHEAVPTVRRQGRPLPLPFNLWSGFPAIGWE
jgi:hypothetical protein